jgi:16S rRNA (cytosine967-C5)-methyltransferase
MDQNRKIAYLTLMDVELKKSYSNIALNHQILCGKPTSTPFIRELVYGVLENKLLLDYVIDHLVDKGISSMKPSDLTILRMGVYQLAKMDSVPEYAAVNESVKLAKRFAKGREGFINGVLRSYIAKKYAIKLPDRSEDEVKYLSIKYSYEPWMVSLWMDVYDTDFVEELLKAGNETPELTIRVNTLRTSKEDLMKALTQRGFKVKVGEHSPLALHVRGSFLLESEFYNQGLFSVQDEASQMVVEMLDPQAGETIIDVCAAPGGKTLAMAEKMHNIGKIVASDIYKRKLDIIIKESVRLGVSIIETKTWDSTKVDSALIDKADRVLVDAPCSGLGVVRRKPEIKYKKFGDEIIGLPSKQVAILSASAYYVKPGGILLYSTCTINPTENDNVVRAFLRVNSSFEIEEKTQYYPNIHGTDGFFICKMKKSSKLVER